MSPLEELLLRFRRLAVPPGLAEPAVVAIDRTLDITIELAPVFAAIDAVEDEADAIERDARARSLQRTTAAQAEAIRLVAEAEVRVAPLRSEALTRRRRSRAHEVRVIREDARREAARISEVARAGMPQLVDRAVRCVASSEQAAGQVTR